MAGLAHRVRVVGLMATDATGHAGDRCSLSHLIQLAHLPMAIYALQPCLKMLAVGPVDSRGHLINPHPDDRLAGLRELGELHNRGPVLCHVVVAAHARCDRRKGHLIAWFGIRVALPALESTRDMRLVAEW